MHTLFKNYFYKCNNDGLTFLQQLVLSKVIMFLRFYYSGFIKMEFCLRSCLLQSQIQLQNFSIKNLCYVTIIFLNLIAQSHCCSVIVLIFYLFCLYFSINIYDLVFVIVPINFFVLIFDLIFFYCLTAITYISFFSLLITCIVFELLFLILIFKFSSVCLLFLAFISHVFLLYGLFYLCKLRVFLLLKKFIMLLVIYNIDVLFFPEMLASNFYISYKLLILNYLVLRKMLDSNIYTLAMLKNIDIHTKYFIFAIINFICFYLCFLCSFDCISYIKNILKINDIYILEPFNSFFIYYVFLGTYFYSFSKIFLLSDKKNIVYKNYCFTFINVCFYSVIALLVKLLIYLHLWPLQCIFLTVSTIWNLTYMASIVFLIKFLK